MKVEPFLGWERIKERTGTATWAGCFLVSLLIGSNSLQRVLPVLPNPDLATVANLPLPHPISVLLPLCLALVAEIVAPNVAAAATGYWRGRLRYRALFGEPDLLPLARVRMPSVEPPDVANAPLQGLVDVETMEPIIADERGVSAGFRLVPWKDALLLEVARADKASLTYVLRDKWSRVAWRVPAAVPTVPRLPASPGKNDLLLAVIRERTGLVPRTLDGSLLAPGEVEPRGGRSWRLMRVMAPFARGMSTGAHVVLGLLALVVLLDGAWGCLTLPLTLYLPLNVYAAGTYILAAAAIPVLALRMTHPRVFASCFTRAPSPLPTLPEAPRDGAWDDKYALSWVPTLRGQASFLSLAVLCLLEAAPGMGGLAALHDAHSTFGEYVLLIIPLLLLGIGGFAALVHLTDLFTAEPARITATPHGLVSGKKAIAWDHLTRLTWKGTAGTGTFTAVGGHMITWPARPDRMLSLPHTQPITPLELAALVAARSGVALRRAHE